MLPGLQGKRWLLGRPGLQPQSWAWPEARERKRDIQGLLSADFFEGFLRDLALSLEGRNRDVRRASSPSSIPSPLPSTFLASLEAQKCSSLTYLIPRSHLEHTEGLTSSGVVPAIVLKAPAVGELVLSIGTTGQTR